MALPLWIRYNRARQRLIEAKQQISEAKQQIKELQNTISNFMQSEKKLRIEKERAELDTREHAERVKSLEVELMSAKVEKGNLLAKINSLKQQTAYLQDLNVSKSTNSVSENNKNNYELFFDQYNGKDARMLFGIPRNMHLGDDLFPNVDRYNREDLWVSISPNGRKYHRKHCYFASLQEPIPIWKVPSKYQACSQCRPPSGDFKWYNDLLELKKSLAKDGITLSACKGKLLLEPRTYNQ